MLLTCQILKVIHVFALALGFRDIIISFLAVKNRSRYIGVTFAIRWQISNATNVIMCIFAVAFTTSDILTFQMFTLEK